MIFTSGSTGTPKGVVVRHRPVINLIEWVNRTFAIGPSDRLLFVTSLSFDLSVYDIFGALAAGASIRVARGHELRDPQQLARILVDEPITFWDSAPAMLQQLAPYWTTSHPHARLRLVFLSGDWIPVTLPDAVRQAFPQAEVVSLGGATEAVIWSNFYRIGDVDPAWTSIPYGRPIQNARYYILDARQQPVPVGVSGDLYIGGPVLSDGYANDPVLTAQKFIPDPFVSDAAGRMYRTGDRARFWPDGNIEFLGRLDEQVTIRGFRIELGEIETALVGHPDVRSAIVVARAVPAGKMLIAYVELASGRTVSPAEVRAHLAARLPDYMVPAAVFVLEAIPMTGSGKVDRKALPAPADRLDDDVVAPPSSDLDRMLVEIWRDVLGIERVGVRDNFFELGGHSLLVVQMHRRLQERLGRELAIVDLFQNPTIESLAKHLATPASGSRATEALTGREERGQLARSRTQQQLNRRTNRPARTEPAALASAMSEVDGKKHHE
jgi:acyl-coenzyme A synthetase/AMP-(fatty) acid ligase